MARLISSCPLQTGSTLMQLLLSPMVWVLVLQALLSGNAGAQGPATSHAFVIRADLPWVRPNHGREIGNMPAIRTQAGLPSCFGCASATIIQKFLCDNDPEFSGPGGDCSRVPPSKMVSQLDMVAWAETNRPRVHPEPKDRPNADPRDPGNHTNIRLGEDRSNYSSATNAIINPRDAFEFMPESCFPVESLNALYGDTPAGGMKFQASYAQGRSLYASLRERSSSEADAIGVAVQQLRANFGSPFTREAVMKAAEMPTYGEFLYALFFGKCERFTSTSRPRLYWNPQGMSRDDARVRIEHAIMAGHPVLISSICVIVYSDRRPCDTSHDLVVSGFRSVCASSDPAAPCRTQFKLHNCWGNAWQEANNKGWVDAVELLRHVTHDKPALDRGDIAWYESVPPKAIQDRRTPGATR